jgi:hypothetical protein
LILGLGAPSRQDGCLAHAPVEQGNRKAQHRPEESFGVVLVAEEKADRRIGAVEPLIERDFGIEPCYGELACPQVRTALARPLKQGFDLNLFRRRTLSEGFFAAASIRWKCALVSSAPSSSRILRIAPSVIKPAAAASQGIETKAIRREVLRSEHQLNPKRKRKSAHLGTGPQAPVPSQNCISVQVLPAKSLETVDTESRPEIRCDIAQASMSLSKTV